MTPKLLLAVLLAATLSPRAAASQSSRVQLSETAVQFGTVLSGAMFDHDVVLTNISGEPLRITRVDLTSPMVVTSMPAFVAPGAEATITLRLPTAGLRGRFNGEVQITVNGADQPEATLVVQSDIVPPVELSPAPAFFLAGRRGEERHATIEIISHETTPLAIESISHSRESFTTSLQTIEQGRRYRLTLRLNPDGPGGRHSEPIVLRTTSQREPAIAIVANTILRERVYTFPDDVDFGTLSMSSIERDPALLQAAAQTLMVYQAGGHAFSVRVHSDSPQLAIASERGPQGDRYQQTVVLNRNGLRVGPIRGSIIIDTNDAEFPRLVVPVSGTIVP